MTRRAWWFVGVLMAGAGCAHSVTGQDGADTAPPLDTGAEAGDGATSTCDWTTPPRLPPGTCGATELQRCADWARAMLMRGETHAMCGQGNPNCYMADHCTPLGTTLPVCTCGMTGFACDVGFVCVSEPGVASHCVAACSQ